METLSFLKKNNFRNSPFCQKGNADFALECKEDWNSNVKIGQTVNSWLYSTSLYDKFKTALRSNILRELLSKTMVLHHDNVRSAATIEIYYQYLIQSWTCNLEILNKISIVGSFAVLYINDAILVCIHLISASKSSSNTFY